MSPAHVLELPRIGPPADCPRSWTVSNPSPVMARTALALLDIGVLRGPMLIKDPAEIVRQSLRAWRAEQHRDMKVFNLDLHVRELEVIGEDLERVNQVSISLNNDGIWPRYRIGSGILQLERAHKGLGETALHWIERAAGRTLPIYTPCEALARCSWIYWGGCDDESEVFEQMALNGDDPEEFEGITREQFDSMIPKLATHPGEKLRRPALKAIAQTHPKSNAGKVAAALLEIAKQIKDCPPDFRLSMMNADDLPCVIRGAYLRWASGDPSERIIDDWGHEIAEMGDWVEGFADTIIACGSAAKPQATADAWNVFLCDIAIAMDILRPVDRLIRLIGEHVHG